jgi:preprotein translocase subunit SecE
VARSSRTRRGRRGEYQAPPVQSRTREERRREREARPPADADGDGATAGAVEPARELHVPGGGFLGFVGESWAELKKVEWPGQRQLISATVAVIIAVAVVGAYLWAADAAFSRLVRDVILNF